MSFASIVEENKYLYAIQEDDNRYFHSHKCIATSSNIKYILQNHTKKYVTFHIDTPECNNNNMHS